MLTWVVLVVVALLVVLVCWPFMRPPRRGALDITGKPFPDIRDYQRDEGDESKDIATEGLGWNVPLGDLAYDRIQVRRSDRRVEKHHPLGHRTTHLAYLHQDEWNLWRPITLAVRR